MIHPDILARKIVPYLESLKTDVRAKGLVSTCHVVHTQTGYGFITYASFMLKSGLDSIDLVIRTMPKNDYIEIAGDLTHSDGYPIFAELQNITFDRDSSEHDLNQLLTTVEEFILSQADTINHLLSTE